MGLKAFFILRFVAIGFISALSYYLLHHMIVLPGPLQPEPVFFLVTGVSTILIMASAYRTLKHESTTPETIIHSADELDLNNPEHVKKLIPHRHNPSDTLEPTEIQEVSSRRLTESPNNSKAPKTPTKRDIERAMKRRTLTEIEHGKIDVKATMEHDENGNLKVTEFTSTIKTDGEAQKQPPKPTFPSHSNIRRRRG